MKCWQLQFNQVEEVCKLNISYKDKFSLEIKFNWLMRKKNIKANLNESTYEEQHKLAAQKTVFSNLASRQMKTKLYFSS